MGDVNGGTIPGTPRMLMECAGNLVAAGVAGSVRLIPALTTDAALWWHQPIDLLYIDADHREASVRADLTTWTPHVRAGGIVAGDDYDNPMYPGVTKAWNDFERERGRTFERYATPQTTPPGMRLIYGVW
jgi:predicted O-methyltransferase YrrM